MSDTRVCKGGCGLRDSCLAQACGSHEEGIQGVPAGADGTALLAESKRHESVLAAVQKECKSARALLRAMSDMEETAPVREEIAQYLHYVEVVVDQIRRRILGGEKIPHAEKVFSIHKPHSRWISKGKAGVLPELGVPVAL